tara:strand:- start:1986 stop:3002 length:1017 start_codon:yes stop_codon:yes gene_type:complete
MKHNNTSIILWLLIGCGMIFAMVIIGGITRLTGSGLSMVDWNLFMGVVPPLNEVEWQKTFNDYKKYPEYQLVNYNITLSEFKNIFYWEYVHRILGRLIGLVFIIPYMFFLFKKRFNTELVFQTTILLLMGAAQGFFGWWMVKSGLVDKPDVSHYRLAVHLITAFLTFAYTFWITLHLIYPKKLQYNQLLYKLSKVLFFIIIVQIIYGAFVAGLNAGKVYNTWPKMNGEWIAESVYALSPFWKNFTEGIAGVQFIHRVLPIIIILTAIYMYYKWKNQETYKMEKMAFIMLFSIISIQVIIGIFTLIKAAPIMLALAHQICAFIMLGVSVFIMFCFKKIN